MTEDGTGLRGDTIPYDVTGDPELDYCAYYLAVENYLAKHWDKQPEQEECDAD
jgi:hypothetical protein